ncbi:MAG TPA: SsrA-binding protein SmpB [Aggregatilineales bacterium]|nr:SsrA-binding protein SmpB [Chloroflexota bacterium]HOA24628.1 SsrA-binding protein SmpB [Aggregatilineales bacterium]HQA69281.1 SsrA-binding protein SmpB [Aggregatilineales bacterium]HQE20028.1 SsrA-binding protein SmpB [Aggregatilineales bacterium]
MTTDNVKVITRNRKARHEYHIEETLEAGMVLTGTEIKSIRAGHASIQEAFVQERDGEMWVVNMHIAQYDPAHRDNHDPLRPRKLLMHRREIENWAAAAQAKGYTIIPLELYLRRGRAKLLIGLARGKKLYDKRQAIAERDAERRMRRAMSERRREQ